MYVPSMHLYPLEIIDFYAFLKSLYLWTDNLDIWFKGTFREPLPFTAAGSRSTRLKIVFSLFLLWSLLLLTDILDV